MRDKGSLEGRKGPVKPEASNGGKGHVDRPGKKGLRADKVSGRETREGFVGNGDGAMPWEGY